MDEKLAALRRHDDDGLTQRERQVLEYRAKGLNFAEIARVLGVFKNRVQEVKLNLKRKGMLTDTGDVSDAGREVLDGDTTDSDGNAA